MPRRAKSVLNITRRIVTVIPKVTDPSTPDAKIVAELVHLFENAPNKEMRLKDAQEFVRSFGVKTGGRGWPDRFWKPAGLKYKPKDSTYLVLPKPQEPPAENPTYDEVTQTRNVMVPSGKPVHRFEVDESVTTPLGGTFTPPKGKRFILVVGTLCVAFAGLFLFSGLV